MLVIAARVWFGASAIAGRGSKLLINLSGDIFKVLAFLSLKMLVYLSKHCLRDCRVGFPGVGVKGDQKEHFD